MQGTKLTLNQLRGGDVLLFEDLTGHINHFLIGAGQSIFSHRSKASSNVTHAGIYDGGGGILEASGANGLRSMKLVEKTAGFKYQVYRFGNRQIAMCAASWAFRLIQERPDNLDKSEGFGRYGTSGAAKSIVTFSYRGKGAKKAVCNLVNDPFEDRAFYCSNFVVECYELACEVVGSGPVIDVDFRKVSPKVLQSNLRKGKDWTYVGNYTV